MRLSARPLDAVRTGTMSINAALREALRLDLMSGKIGPGTKLKIPLLSAHYSVTPGAIREALGRLVPEGLVSFEDQRGFWAAEVTLKELQDVTRVRLLIEREALSDAIRHGDENWEAAVLAAGHRLARRNRPAGDAASLEAVDWAKCHRDFHATVVSACQSEWLLRMRNILYDQSERYRVLSSHVIAPPRADGRIDEHVELAGLVIARDQAGAVKLMEDHIRNAADRAALALRMNFGAKEPSIKLVDGSSLEGG